MLPDAPLTIKNGGLGIVPPPTDRKHALIGVCTGGTPNTVYEFNDVDTLVATLLGGPTVEAAAVSLVEPGTGSVVVVPVNASVTGTRGSVTRHTDGSVDSTFTLSGNPLDDLSAIVKFLTGATNLAAATATFQYSTDGGKTFSPIYALSTSGVFAIPGTGVTFTIADGAGTTVVAGDYYTWTSTGPGFNATDLNNAGNALLADSRTWNFLHVVGRATSGSGSATIAATIATLMAKAETKIRYTWAVMEAANDTDANLKAAFASFVSARVMVCAGEDLVTSPISGQQKMRSTAWKTAARLAAIPISQAPAAVEDGPLTSVNGIGRDEQVTPGLDDARFTTHRTFPGLQGVWITNGRMMEVAGGDYQYVQLRRVMDRACEVAHLSALRYLSKKVRVNPKTVKAPAVPGGIAETDAIAIEKNISQHLNDELVTPGHATAASVSLSRTANLLSSGTDPLTIRIVADGYILSMPINIGYENPALSA